MDSVDGSFVARVLREIFDMDARRFSLPKLDPQDKEESRVYAVLVRSESGNTVVTSVADCRALVAGEAE